MALEPEAGKGPLVAAELERRLEGLPGASLAVADAVVVLEVLRRWYGPAAPLVLRAALQLAEVSP